MKLPLGRLAMLAAVLAIHLPAQAQPVTELLAKFDAAARRDEPGFAGPSAQRGAAFFAARHGGQWSCSTCHTTDPRATGRHAVTGKSIEPLAPAANPARLSDAARVEKWLRRNCKDVLARECSAAEKADVIAYLQSLK